MTSKQIQDHIGKLSVYFDRERQDKTQMFALWEIANQLAIHNERNEPLPCGQKPTDKCWYGRGFCPTHPKDNG